MTLRRIVKRKRGAVFSLRVPAGAPVSVPAGGAGDRYRNIAAAGLRLR